MSAQPPTLFPIDGHFPADVGIIKNARILLVDDEDGIRDILEELLTSLGSLVRSFQSPLAALAHVETTFYNVILLDIVMPELSGLELLPKMTRLSPGSKFIMVTGCASKENAIQAFRSGAFDFLEKPVSFELLSHAVVRALRAQQTEFKLIETLDQLEKSNAKLTVQKINEDRMKEWLVETNRALSTLARNLESTRLESENRIAETTRELILPVVAKLCQDEIVFSKYPNELGLLIQCMEDVTHNSASEDKMPVLLSQKELQVASLIKLGMTTREIAEHLKVSAATVKNHRRNIRKKLKNGNMQKHE